jgi:hypothetical protein
VGATQVSLARALQYAGHVLGALATVALLRHIARERLLARWYGAAYERMGPAAPPASHRAMLAAALVATGAAGVAWGAGSNTSGFILRVAAAMGAGLTAVALAVGDHPAYRVARP